MDNRIHSIIETVQRRESKRRLHARLIIAALLISTVSVLFMLLAHYPTWMLLLWIAPLIVALCVVWKAPRERLSVSIEQASALLDSHLNTKERVRTFTYLSLSSAAPDIVRGTFIAQQIHEHIEPSFSPETVVSLRLSRSQQIALTCSVACATLAVALYILRPLSPRDEIARTMAEILANDQTIPEEVRLATEQAIQDLASSDMSVAQESLQRAEDEVLQALESATETSSKERTIQADKTNRGSAPLAQEPSPPTPPAQLPRPEKARKEQQQQSTKPEDNKQPEQPQKSQSDNEKKQKEQQSSQEKAPGGDSEKGGDDDSRKEEQSQQSQSQKGGNSSSGASEESKDGEGQGGGGQGSGASGAGTGSQGENQQEQGASQGSSGASKDGHGEGEGTGNESQDSSKPQGSGAKQGNPQPGGSTGTSGLEQLKDSLQKAETALAEEQAQQQGASQEGSKGKDEGDKQGDSDKGKDGENQGNSKEGDAPGTAQSASGSSNNKSSPNNNGKGTGGSGNNPKSKKEDAPSSGSQGNTTPERPKNDPQSQKGSGSSSQQGEAPKPDQKQERNESNNSGEGVGELSSMPDRSAQPSTDDPGEGPGSGSPNLPVEFTESEIGSAEEQLDSRFTGSEATTEKNKLPANAKTTLEDVLLAKPQGSVHRGEQPIPLEYRELLEKRQ